MDLLNAFLGRSKADDEEIGEPGSENNPIVSKSGAQRRFQGRKMRRLGNAFARRSQRDYIRSVKPTSRGNGSFLIGGPVEGNTIRSVPKGASKYGHRRDIREAQLASTTAAAPPVEVSPS